MKIVMKMLVGTERAKHLPRNRVGLASLWDGAIKWLGGRG